jgi:hypothetical protein
MLAYTTHFTGCVGNNRILHVFQPPSQSPFVFFVSSWLIVLVYGLLNNENAIHHANPYVAYPIPQPA